MIRLAAAFAATLFVASAADAATVTVTPGSGWQAETGNGNTGTATITNAQARDGNGSLELRGDRTRYYTGASGNNLAAIFAPVITSMSNVTGLTFDWRIAGDTVSALGEDYTPALRLIIRSGTTVRELIWEGAYNGVYGLQTVPDTWYSTTTASKFYISGSPGNENDGKTIAEWAVSNASWNVVGLSVGQGSSAGVGYHAFADNVTLATRTATTTYNFETAVTAAVPEPGTWAMLLIGFGAAGAAARRRRPAVAFAA